MAPDAVAVGASGEIAAGLCDGRTCGDLGRSSSSLGDGKGKGRPSDAEAALVVAAVTTDQASQGSRERADIADLIRHVQQIQPSLSPTSEQSSARAAERQRSASWCDAAHRHLTSPEVSEHRRQLCTPGGFRRDHLQTCADARGLSHEQRPATWSVSLVDSLVSAVRLYEHSYGLPLADDDGQPLLEHRHLGGRGLSNMGVAVAVFKGNLCVNIFYMAHAWEVGGYSFGAIIIPVLAALSVFCVILLVRCQSGGQSYSDIMNKALGTPGRLASSTFVVLLQVGQCCGYLINVANMLRSSFFPSVEPWMLMLAEAALVAPLVLIRNVAKLSPVNLVGSLLTIVGVLVTFFLVGEELTSAGPQEMHAFKPSGLLVCLGIACYTFEGIGLVLPIYDAHRSPEHFALVYSLTLGLIVILMSGMAFAGCLTFGSTTNTLLLMNLPDGLPTKAIRLTFSMVMLAGFPLQLLPAVRIVEGVFLAPSRPLTWDKHVKSAFRVAFVGLVAGISILGSTSLDHFVALVGAVCGLPLCFIFPAICHRRLVATPGSIAATVDMLLILCGTAVTVAVGCETIATWGS